MPSEEAEEAVHHTAAASAAAELDQTSAVAESIAQDKDLTKRLLAAAGVPVEPIWAQLLSKALEGKDVKDLLTNVGAAGPAVAAAPAAGAAAVAAQGQK